MLTPHWTLFWSAVTQLFPEGQFWLRFPVYTKFLKYFFTVLQKVWISHFPWVLTCPTPHLTDPNALEISTLGLVRRVAQKIVRIKPEQILAGSRCSWGLFAHHDNARNVCRRDGRGTVSLHAALLTEHLVSHRHRLCLISFICVGSKWNGVFGLQLSVKLLSSSHPALHRPTWIVYVTDWYRRSNLRVIAGYTHELQMKISLLGTKKSFVLLQCCFM
jgi:hypothetical protein